MNRRRIVSILVVVLVLVGLAAIRMRRLHEKTRAPLLAPVPTAVRVVPVDEGGVARTEHVLGEVVGDAEIEIAPRVMAQVVGVTVRAGDNVRQGQVLVELDPRELEDALDAAEAAMAAADEAYRTETDATERDRVLYEAGAISEEQWDRSRTREAAAKARLVAARSAVDRARTRRAYATLRAPVDGTVLERMVDPGDLAVVGRPLLRMVEQGTVRVQAKLPSATMGALRVGQTAHLYLGDEQVDAKIARFAKALDRQHLALVEIDLPQPPPGFVAGTTVGVDLELESAQGLRVPTTSLLESDSGATVFRVRSREAGHELEVVPVKVMTRTADLAVVEGGLSPGDSVVVARPSRLMTFAAGTPVRIDSPSQSR